MKSLFILLCTSFAFAAAEAPPAVQDTQPALSAAAIESLAQALDSPEPAARQSAFERLRELAGRSAGTPAQAEVGAALARAFDNPRSAEARRALCRLLSVAPAEEALPALYRALGDPEVQEEARVAIAHTPGRAATQALMAALQISEPPFLLRVIDALGARGDPIAVPALAGGIEAEDPAIRGAALRALAAIPDRAALAPLLDAANRNVPGAADAAILLGQKAGEEKRGELARAVFEALARRPDLNVEQMCGLFAVLGGAEPAALAEPVPAQLVQRAASAGPRAWNCLLDAFARVPGTEVTGAITALLKKQLEVPAATQPTAGEVSVTAGLLDVLGRRGDVSALPEVSARMQEGPWRREAASALIRLAARLPEARRAEAIDALRRALPVATQPADVQQAIDQLRRLGEDVDPARDQGFITVWHVLGPFPNADDALWERACFPEPGGEWAPTTQVADTRYTWKAYRTPGTRGVVDLAAAVAPEADVGAYAYAEITVETEQDVVLRIGSDDSVAVWINSRQVHANRVRRGLTIDQDQARARLKAGVNRVLVKCLNNAYAWGFSLRVTTLAGQPVRFRQDPPGRRE